MNKRREEAAKQGICVGMRFLYINEFTNYIENIQSTKAMVINETKRGSKASVKSVSPPAASGGIDEAKNGRTERGGGATGGSSSQCSTDARNTSPISMVCFFATFLKIYSFI
jgi:hypothetical protein